MAEPEAADLFDRMANPHPRMWVEATQLYTKVAAGPTAIERARWDGYLQAMSAATGYERSYFVEKLAAETGLTL